MSWLETVYWGGLSAGMATADVRSGRFSRNLQARRMLRARLDEPGPMGGWTKRARTQKIRRV